MGYRRARIAYRRRTQRRSVSAARTSQDDTGAHRTRRRTRSDLVPQQAPQGSRRGGRRSAVWWLELIAENAYARFLIPLSLRTMSARSWRRCITFCRLVPCLTLSLHPFPRRCAGRKRARRRLSACGACADAARRFHRVPWVYARATAVQQLSTSQLIPHTAGMWHRFCRRPPRAPHNHAAL